MKFNVICGSSSHDSKICIFHKGTFGKQLDDTKTLSSIATYNKIDIHFYETTNSTLLHNRGNYRDHLKIENDSNITKEYDYIYNYIRENNIKICIFLGSGYSWSQNFIFRLKKITYCACYFADDPDGSEETSKYYVKLYDYAFCGGVFFDNKITVTKKYLEWGAKKSMFIPIGFNSVKFKIKYNSAKARPYDVIFVGSCFLTKTFKIFKLKKHFGNKMLLFGKGWNTSNNIIKTLILKSIKKLYGIGEINPISDNDLIKYYQNTKVGINMHITYGPSNVRNYEIPACGCMLVTDCPSGTKKLYNTSKEVLTYNNTKDAINIITHYLKDNKARNKIAFAGYKKVHSKYTLNKTFQKIIQEINNDITSKTHHR